MQAQSLIRRAISGIKVGASVAMLAGAVAGNSAWAQAPAWPTQTVKIIVPFTPGTGMDTIARVVAPRLSERLGQSVVVQNQPGASGNIGASSTPYAVFSIAIAARQGANDRFDGHSITVVPVGADSPMTCSVRRQDF